MKRLNLVGQKFGLLNIISLNRISGCSYWDCICDCGNKRVVSVGDLRNGHTKSCGCLRSTKPGNFRHGMTDNHFHKTWSRMLRRTRNKNSKDYSRYGAKGIFTCDEWNRFETFRDDMFDSYSAHISVHGEGQTTLDRVDNSKGYSKENCRWATWTEQNNNKSNNKLLSYNGETYTVAQFCKKLGIKYHTNLKRYHKGTLPNFFDVTIINEP